MKKVRFLILFINRLSELTALLTLFTILSCNAQSAINSATVFKRAQSLNNGISISWMEQTWNKNILDEAAIKPSDLQLLKKLGFKSIRLPVAFEYFQANNSSINKVLERVDEILKLCHLYELKLIICYHSGNLTENTYQAETPKIIGLWTLLAKKYINESANDLFFEIYNEPPHMNPDIWNDAANKIILAIRKVDKSRTLIVGASNFNSIYELSRTVPFDDENIIYTFHFYEPFFFTHQGASWIGDQAATTGVPFPYNGENFPGMNAKAHLVLAAA